jgi:hypothetical protein
LLPTLCLPTGKTPTAPTANPPLRGRELMMPKRRHTREQDRTHRINNQRTLNTAHLPERNQPPPF